MDLREARICEIGSFLVALPCGRTVAVHGVGREEVGVAVAAGGDHHSMGAESLKLAGHEVTGDDTLCLSVDEDEIKHLVARIAGHSAGCNLTVEGGIGSKKKLLTGLSSCIERTAYLNTSERTVGEIAAVLTGERNTLRDALVDDGRADLGETVHVRLTAAVVSSLDRVVEETVDSVVVILIVLSGIDTTLRGDGVSAAR